jgi:HSP20 family molecular chaperone IbpA
VKVSTEPRLAVVDPGRKYILREQSLQPTSRILELPLDTDNVRASLEYGILKIRVGQTA